MPPRFGIFPSPSVEELGSSLEAVQVADREGLDLVGIQDHPYQRRFLDTFTLLPWLASRTERIHLFPDVASLPLRPPAVLAKASASLALLSGDRFVLGLGAGAVWEAIDGFGGPRRSAGQAVEALVEALEVIRMVWSGERGLRFEGEHYHLRGVHGGPSPGSPIPIWVGATGPRMLGVIGRMCDGWVVSQPYVPPHALASKHRIIDEAADEAGRDPASVTRVYNVAGVITDGHSEGFLKGPAEQWAEQLLRLHSEYRMDGFILWPEGEVVDQVRRFAEVAFMVRQEAR